MKISLLYIITILIVSVWVIRNYHYFNRFVISTSSEIATTIPFLDTDEFSFFESYRLTKFAEKHSQTIVISDSIRNALNKNDIAYPQGYVYESIGDHFNESAHEWKKNHPGLYALRTAYLLKVVLSPYTQDMGKRNKVISLFLWLLTIFPAFIGWLFYKKLKPQYFLLFFSGLSLLILPTMIIIDTNLRYQLPTQLLYTVLAGNIISIFISRYLKKIDE